MPACRDGSDRTQLALTKAAIPNPQFVDRYQSVGHFVSGRT